MKKINLTPVDFTCDITEPIFGKVYGNRNTNPKHVQEIKRAMMLGAIIPPLMIDAATKTIVDGQHRYQAAIELWNEGIKYPLCALYYNYEDALEAAITFNNTSRAWVTEERVNAYVAQGKQSYILLKRFCETHELLNNGGKLIYEEALHIITGSSSHLKDGLLRITESNLVKAEVVYQELSLMVEILGNPLPMRRHHSLAWMKVRDIILSKMSLTEWLSKLGNNFSTPMSDKRDDWANEYLRIALL